MYKPSQSSQFVLVPLSDKISYVYTYRHERMIKREEEEHVTAANFGMGRITHLVPRLSPINVDLQTP